MRKNIILIFVALALICSCSGKDKTAADWTAKEKALWDGQKYTNPEKAIEYLDKAIKLQPNNPELYNKKGTAYYNMGQYQHTIEMTSEAIRLMPKYFLAYNNRGNSFANLGQFQKAIEDYNQVISLKPDFSVAYDSRGTIHLLTGNKDMGCRDVKKACELGNCRKMEEARSKGYCP